MLFLTPSKLSKRWRQIRLTAHWLVPNYIAWWQRHKDVNNLPRVVTQPLLNRESKPRPPDRNSNVKPVTLHTIQTKCWKSKQELSSCWDGQPFGHNINGLKIGEGAVVPLSVGGAGSPSNTMSPGPTKWHLDASKCLATIHQHYKQTDRTVVPIGWTVTCNCCPKSRELYKLGKKTTNVQA